MMKSEDIKVVAEMISAYHQEAVVPVTKELQQVVKLMEELLRDSGAGCKCSDGDCCNERED